MMRFISSILAASLVLVLCAVPLVAFAQEEIHSFEVSLTIREDASVGVEEVIVYDFGEHRRHGIFRTIPVRYDTDLGSYRIRIDDISVTDDTGNPYLFDVNSKGGSLELKIGNPDLLISGEHTYVIRYVANRVFNYFESHDELYWNAIGHNWQVPISEARTTVVFPREFETQEVSVTCFTGQRGSQEECGYEYYPSIYDTITQYIVKESNLSPGEGMTVAVGIPKGVVAKPSTYESIQYTVQDNAILGLPVVVFLILYYVWYTRGRDPEGRKVIYAQYEPPPGLTPAQVGTIVDEKAHERDISAEIVELAVLGHLTIKRLEEKGFIFKSADYEFTHIEKDTSKLAGFQKKLLDALFKNKDTVTLSALKNKFHKTLKEVTDTVYESTVQKGYFYKNPKTVRTVYQGISVVFFVISVWVFSWFGFLGVFAAVVSGIMIALFSFLMPARTKKGVIAKEHILGLKEYLSLAEKERIAFHNAPEKSPALFEKLLPYAMVLGVEREWARQFEGLYDGKPAWYQDTTGTTFTALYLTEDLNSFASRAQSTLSSAPASAGGSGIGGGGFSGGGFGGGGGGSW